MRNDIFEMHTKYGVRKWMLQKAEEKDWETLLKFLRFRFEFIQEELNETKSAVDNSQPEEVVDGLIDILVVGIGTLDAFGVDIDEAWTRVHKANMAKEVGVKESRPNPLGLPDLIKPDGWKSPNHRGNVGFIGPTVKPDNGCNCYSCYMRRGYNV